MTMPTALAHYGLAVGTVLLAWGCKIALISSVGAETTVIFFVLAIVGSAGLLGPTPGLLAAVLAVGADMVPVRGVLLTGPEVSVLAILLRSLLLVGVGVLASWLATARFTRGKGTKRPRDRESAPLQSDDRLPRTLEAASLGTWDWNPTTQRMVWSQINEQLVGFGPGEFDGRCESWRKRVHADDWPGIERKLREAAQSQESFRHEYRVVWPDDSMHWLEMVGRYDGNGGQAGNWRGVTLDVTARKLLEEDLRCRAAALAEADRRKDEFLAMLSHELRNPLAPIRNAIQILNSYEPADTHQQDARDIIDRQVNQLAGIVDDLLDVFRIAHHKIPMHKEVFDLADLVRLTAEDHRTGLENKCRTLTLQLPTEPVWVDADRRRLAQVLTNLLQNAAKFTNARDDITVAVETDPMRLGATVVVRDTGIGIDPALLPNVFDIFTQGDVSLDRRRGGLGLGLGLVKGLVELHGGKVQAVSAGLGQGTEMRVWLPTARPPSKPGVSTSALPATARRCLRILIVEDNLDTAKSMHWLLTRYGHEVQMAHSGTAGVETAKEWRPDVVLCDLGLPELDGYDVARALRGDPTTTWARLIAVSGYGQDQDRERSDDAGFDLHLTKPVDPANLLRLLAVLKIGPEVHDGVPNLTR
jgi:signal transduction histidine kinase/ActR/RegA family two-component response regulator